MKYDKCHNCGEWGRTDTHKCPPKWIVHIEGDSEGNEYGVRVIYAMDAEGAAEKFAHRYDVYFAEYGLAGGGESIDVVVCHPTRHEERLFFTVTGAEVPQYTAQAKK